mgnify:CR=1 FL=1
MLINSGTIVTMQKMSFPPSFVDWAILKVKNDTKDRHSTHMFLSLLNCCYGQHYQNPHTNNCWVGFLTMTPRRFKFVQMTTQEGKQRDGFLP